LRREAKEKITKTKRGASKTVQQSEKTAENERDEQLLQDALYPYSHQK
jgi:hypothetical protein